MGWTFRLWLCTTLPWHRWLSSSFWVSALTEVRMCSCGRQWAMNHDAQAILPWDDETKDFYRKWSTFG